MPLPPVDFPTLGWEVIDWIETYTCCGPGDVQGDPFVIDDEEALFLLHAYRLWPKGHPLEGRRLVHRGIYSRPKGRRKSMLAGGLVLAEALGPVRFDGWNANGDPVGRPVTYPFIRCLATEEEQTGNTYDNVIYMGQEGRVAEEYDLDVGLTRTFIREPGGGEIIPSTAGAASKDGGKETFAVADETHLYVQGETRSMYRTVARNTGKRKAAEPWMLDTTTAWEPGERSIAELAADRYQRLPLEEAVTKKGVLYDHAQGDEPKRFGDDRSLIKAMRVGYGPAASWMDFDRIVKIIRDAEDPEGEAYRYFLNRPRAAAAQWLGKDAIDDAFQEFKLPKKRGKRHRSPLGFDGSEKDDHTALWGCTEAGDLFAIGIWIPNEAGWQSDVTAAVDWTFEKFDVVRFYGDPPWWQDQMGAWAEKHNVPAPPKPRIPPVIEFWTNVDSKMAVACGALRTGINGRTLKIDPVPLWTPEIRVNAQGEPIATGGTPLAQWHFENARKRKVKLKLEDHAEEAFVVRKERPMSPLKIDSVPAAALAKRARDDAVKNGEFVQVTYGRAAW
jgi:hypothetical protein